VTRPQDDGLVVVRLEDPKRPAGPARVIDVFYGADTVYGTSVDVAKAGHRDRDGALPDDIRVWRRYDGAKLGDRVSLVDGSAQPVATAKVRNIARLTEFDAQDRQSSVLCLVWHAREYLGDAERKEDAIFPVRVRWCEDASAALEAARAMMMRENVWEGRSDARSPALAIELLSRACSASTAAIANGQLATAYHAASRMTGPLEWDTQRTPKAISIFKRASETARQETHRALVELCELFPDAMPTEE